MRGILNMLREARERVPLDQTGRTQAALDLYTSTSLFESDRERAVRGVNSDRLREFIAYNTAMNTIMQTFNDEFFQGVADAVREEIREESMRTDQIQDSVDRQMAVMKSNLAALGTRANIEALNREVAPMVTAIMDTVTERNIRALIEPQIQNIDDLLREFQLVEMHLSERSRDRHVRYAEVLGEMEDAGIDPDFADYVTVTAPVDRVMDNSGSREIIINPLTDLRTDALTLLDGLGESLAQNNAAMYMDLLNHIRDVRSTELMTPTGPGVFEAADRSYDAVIAELNRDPEPTPPPSPRDPPLIDALREVKGKLEAAVASARGRDDVYSAIENLRYAFVDENPSVVEVGDRIAIMRAVGDSDLLANFRGVTTDLQKVKTLLALVIARDVGDDWNGVIDDVQSGEMGRRADAVAESYKDIMDAFAGPTEIVRGATRSGMSVGEIVDRVITEHRDKLQVALTNLSNTAAEFGDFVPLQGNASPVEYMERITDRLDRLPEAQQPVQLMDVLREYKNDTILPNNGDRILRESYHLTDTYIDRVVDKFPESDAEISTQDDLQTLPIRPISWKARNHLDWAIQAEEWLRDDLEEKLRMRAIVEEGLEKLVLEGMLYGQKDLLDALKSDLEDYARVGETDTETLLVDIAATATVDDETKTADTKTADTATIKRFAELEEKINDVKVRTDYGIAQVTSALQRTDESIRLMAPPGQIGGFDSVDIDGVVTNLTRTVVADAKADSDYITRDLLPARMIYDDIRARYTRDMGLSITSVTDSEPDAGVRVTRDQDPTDGFGNY
jgi:hypothetical protein